MTSIMQVRNSTTKLAYHFYYISVFLIYIGFLYVLYIKKNKIWASKFGRPNLVELFAPPRADPVNYVVYPRELLPEDAPQKNPGGSSQRNPRGSPHRMCWFISLVYRVMIYIP